MTIYFTYDADKYFSGTVEADAAPENSTTIEPEFKEGYWSKFTGKKWENEKIPETAEDIIGLSVPAPVVYPAEDPATQHQQILRSVIMRILSTTEDAKAVVNDDTLTVVKVTDADRLAEAKTAKLQALSAESSKYQAWNCKEMYITSSLGFAVNSDQCSQNNISVLIGMLPDDTTTTSFKVYDNTFKALNKPQLKTLLSECAQAGLALYQTKFGLQEAINKATTKEELDAIEIKFEMADFSKTE